MKLRCFELVIVDLEVSSVVYRTFAVELIICLESMPICVDMNSCFKRSKNIYISETSGVLPCNLFLK